METIILNKQHKACVTKLHLSAFRLLSLKTDIVPAGALQRGKIMTLLCCFFFVCFLCLSNGSINFKGGPAMSFSPSIASQKSLPILVFVALRLRVNVY